jgi:hypothetical protein
VSSEMISSIAHAEMGLVIEWANYEAHRRALLDRERQRKHTLNSS